MAKRKILNPANRVTHKQEKLTIKIMNIVVDVNINASIFEKLSVTNNNDYDVENKTVLDSYWNEEKKISPVYRYSIKKNEQSLFDLFEFEEKNSKFENSNFNDFPIEMERELESIVIILESPHKSEYNDENMPIAPAQGETGDQIEEKICEILNSQQIIRCLTSDEYRIVILNPIPFQTSLFMLHKQSISGVYKTLRDKVWITLWNNCNKLKIDFINSIQELNPKVLINCCTAGVKGNIPLEQFLCDKYEIDHPSCWWKGLNNISIKAV